MQLRCVARARKRSRPSPWLVEVRTFADLNAASPASSELRLRAQRSELATARKYAAEAAAAFGLDTDGCYEFVYAVNEAVTNAIKHGLPDERGLICLSIAADADRLTFAVRDCGTFVTPLLDTAASLEHGRGFALMNGLMDEVQLCIGPGSTTVRLSKARA
jgi:anti-sigma regulatory factor (Ser/Thr protein kinase)